MMTAWVAAGSRATSATIARRRRRRRRVRARPAVRRRRARLGASRVVSNCSAHASVTGKLRASRACGVSVGRASSIPASDQRARVKSSQSTASRRFTPRGAAPGRRESGGGRGVNSVSADQESVPPTPTHASPARARASRPRRRRADSAGFGFGVSFGFAEASFGFAEVRTRRGHATRTVSARSGLLTSRPRRRRVRPRERHDDRPSGRPERTSREPASVSAAHEPALVPAGSGTRTQRAIATDAVPRRLARRWHERRERRRSVRRGGLRRRRVRTRRAPNAQLRLGARRRRRFDVAPLVSFRTPNAHLRRSAVRARHGGNLSRDFCLPRGALFLRRRVSPPRLANLLAVEIPKRDGVPRRARLEHLVRYPRVRLEENQTPADRGDVCQTHGGGGESPVGGVLLRGSERGDTHALRDVPGPTATNGVFGRSRTLVFLTMTSSSAARGRPSRSTKPRRRRRRRRGHRNTRSSPPSPSAHSGLR